jgi:hypothetical protein
MIDRVEQFQMKTGYLLLMPFITVVSAYLSFTCCENVLEPRNWREWHFVPQLEDSCATLKCYQHMVLS